MNRPIVYFIPAVIWGAILLYLSLMAGNKMPDLSFFSLFQPDKVGHFVSYALLVALLLFGFYKKAAPKEITRFTIIMVVIFTICYGIVIEWMQISFSTGRYFEFLDIIANIIGSFIGLLSLKTFNKINI